MIYMITGHLGSGKSLLAVALAQTYLLRGCRVASNITLNLDHLVEPTSKQTIDKLPPIPSPEHLNALGNGYEGPYNEEKFGFLLLDECGTWLNSHDWKDKNRRATFNYITHARKYGWDVGLIIQDWESLDAQIRRSVCEVYVACSRLDRIKMPFLPIRLPRCHLATARYQGPTGPLIRRWYTRGTGLFAAYDTREAIKPDLLFTEDGAIDMSGPSSRLSAWHLHGRYLPPRLTWLDYLSVVCGLAVLATLGAFLSACLGRRPWQALGLAWTRWKATRQPSPYLAVAQASRAV